MSKSEITQAIATLSQLLYIKDVDSELRKKVIKKIGELIELL